MKCNNCEEEYRLEEMDYYTNYKGKGVALLCKNCSPKQRERTVLTRRKR